MACNLRVLFFSSFFLTSALAQVASPLEKDVKIQTQSARAYDASGAIVYREKHLTFYSANKLLRSETTYTDPNGKLIATLKSDYEKSLTMPTYVFEDSRRRHQEGLRFENGKYVIFSKDGDQPERTKLLTNTSNVFSCQGWHYFLVNNLDQLEKKSLELELIFPDRLEHIGFTLSKADKKENEIHLRLAVSNFFIRLFAPRLELYYDAKDKKLTRFVGPSNIVDSNGKLQTVEIKYD